MSGKYQVLLVAIILLLAYTVRVIDIGTAPLQGDEVQWAYLAYQFGHEGARSEMGMPSSRGINLAPLVSDVFALPFAFHPDPRMARLYMATLHLIGMALLYALVKRYWSWRTALIALLIYAAMPNLIWGSRYIWNVNLVPPLMIFYLLTGFAVTEGRRGGHWLHPLALTLMVQTHPSTAVYAPLSLVFYGSGWWQRRYFPWQQHLLGGTVALLATLPWLIGLLHAPENTRPVTDGASPVYRIWNHAATVWDYMEFGAYSLPQNTYTPLFPQWQYVEKSIGWIMNVGAIFLLGRGLWRQYDFRTSLIGAAYLLLPVALMGLPVPSYVAYMAVILPMGAMILALLLQYWRVGVVMAGMFAVMGMGMTLDAYAQVRQFKKFDRESLLFLNETVDLVRTAQASPYEVIYLVEGSGGEEYEQALAWEILSQGRRVIWGQTTTLPLPRQGVTYVGFADARHIPELYADRPARLTVRELYRIVDVPPENAFPVTCAAQGATRLQNSAVILGFYTPEQPAPQAGENWRIYLLWQGQPHVTGNYQMFVHLVDAESNRYAQQDVELPGRGSWREGDLMVSEIQLLPPLLPEHTWLNLRVGMYMLLPEFRNEDVLNDDNYPVGQWVEIPICTQ